MMDPYAKPQFLIDIERERDALSAELAAEQESNTYLSNLRILDQRRIAALEHQVDLFGAWQKRDIAQGERIATLEAALLKYGYHEADCDYLLDTLPCTCGYEAMRTTLETVSTMDHGGVGQVGCENPDGTLTVHGENETCAVCSSPETTAEPERGEPMFNYNGDLIGYAPETVAKLHEHKWVASPDVYCVSCNYPLCSDCPPVGYPTDETRCAQCPRSQAKTKGEQDGL